MNMSTITQIKIRQPDDFHVHLREGAMLAEVLPHTAKRYGRALVMPNLKHPVRNGGDARSYENQIETLSTGTNFTPLMTIKLTQDTTPGLITAARSSQVVAAKLYPEGVTTNSQNGVTDLGALESVFAEMEKCGMVLCVHAEEPGVFSMDREKAYLPHIDRLSHLFRNLRIVIEHVTSAETVKFVKEALPNVAATITAHHLFITLDDVVGDKLNPHNFCKPIAKTPRDREALLDAAFHDKRFFFGSDSAPHDRDTKECGHGCAGCFTAPHAMELLCTLFDKHGVIHALERFTSESGARFYGLDLNREVITLQRGDWVVPSHYGTVIPFMAGETIPWKIID